ncbi:GTPase IMAP family member 7, partial [Anabarilius grahami]
PRKIVLLGKTGDGKSSSGNTIINEQRFPTESSPESITAQFQTEIAMVYGRTVTAIDTPGIFDTRLDEAVIRSEIIGSIIECAPAVDAFVIVLKVQRYTKQEIEILNKIVEYCGEETFKHAVVLFTHGEELEGQTIEEFVKISPKLQELVNKCGGRCHVIDNKHWNNCHLGYRSNKVHVKNLMETIDKMVQENGCFTNELMSSVDKEIEEIK